MDAARPICDHGRRDPMIDTHTWHASPALTVTRCFRCPQQRAAYAAGWHFVDVPEHGRSFAPRAGHRRRPGQPPLRMRFYVCPHDYATFAEAERARWMPVPSGAAE
jgi:hypothetical protein